MSRRRVLSELAADAVSGPKRKGHGGKREGPGPKPRLTQDDRWDLGSDCETEHDAMKYRRAAQLKKDGKWVLGRHVKRPKGPKGESIRKQIIRRVAKRWSETDSMVRVCWLEYRRQRIRPFKS
jgi:hypothetical protein